MLRAATASDYPHIRALVFGMHTRALAPLEVATRLPLIFPPLASAEDFLSPAHHSWVTEEEGTAGGISGAISIILGEGGADAAELNYFYVADAHQRRGLGARLMDEALAFCRAAGVRRVGLTSNVGHYEPAIAYYGKRGFARTKQFEVAPGIVLVEMELELQ